MALAFGVLAAHRVLAVLRGEIMNMNRPTIACGSSNHCVSVCRYCLAGMANLRKPPVRSYQPKKLATSRSALRPFARQRDLRRRTRPSAGYHSEGLGLRRG